MGWDGYEGWVWTGEGMAVLRDEDFFDEEGGLGLWGFLW